MVDSAGLGDVVDECAARSSELVVEDDACGEAEEALEDAFSDALESAAAVAFEGEEVFEGPEDRLDSLADRRETRSSARFVFAARTHDRGVQFVDLAGEVAAGVALVAQQRLAAGASGASKQLKADVALVTLGRGERKRSRRAVRCEDRMQAKAPEEPGMTGAPAVVGSVAQLRAVGGFTAAGTLDRRRVDEQQIILEPWALAREDSQQPLDRVRQAPAALVVPRLRGQLRKQVRESLPGNLEEAPIARDPHDRLRNAERDDLRVRDPSPGVPGPLGQEIVRRAINDGAESVEVGVHRGLQVDGALDTADFGLSATNPSNTANTVESTI